MNILVTNHAHVLACISRDKSARLRDLALQTSLTERAVQRLVKELEEGGFLRRVREGRRNRYELLAEPLHALSQRLLALASPGADAYAPVVAEPGAESPVPATDAGDGISRRHSFID